MKKSILWTLIALLVAAFSSVYVAGCNSSNGGGGGGGPVIGQVGGGASTFSQGIISDSSNGTVTVNGIEYDTSNAEIMINGQQGTSEDLQTGQFVRIKGGATGTTGAAGNLEVLNMMTGPVNGTPEGDISSGATMTVLGQTILADASTFFEPNDLDLASIGTGSVLEISGLADDAGNILATFVRSRPDAANYDITGIVSALSGSTFTLTPNGNGAPLTVTMGPGATVVTSGGTGTTSVGWAGTTGSGTGGTGSTDGSGTGGTGSTDGMGTGGTGTTDGIGTGGTGTTDGMGTGGTGTTGGTGGTGGTGAGGAGTATLADGQTVTITIDPADFTPGSQNVTATSVMIRRMLTPSEGSAVFIVGFPADISGNSFVINDISVDAGSATPPEAGQLTAVHGTFSNGVVTADVIEPAFLSMLTMGAISSVSTATNGAGGTATGTMTVNGVTFDIGSAQITMNGQAASTDELQAGRQVVVKSPGVNFADVLSGGTGTTGAGAGGTGGLDTSGTGTMGAGPGGIDTGGTGTIGTGTGGLDTGGTTTDGGSIGTGTGSGGTAGVDTGGTGGLDTSGTGTPGTGTGGTGGLATGGTGTTGCPVPGTIKADRIWIIDNMQGPISGATGSLSSQLTGTGMSETASIATFTVFSQTVTVDGRTRFGQDLMNLMSTNTGSLAGLASGDVIDVSGIPAGNGSLLATFLDSRATTTSYHVVGLVSGATGSPVMSFTLTPVPGGTPLTVSVMSNEAGTGIANDMFVSVVIDPASFTPGQTSITAMEVHALGVPQAVMNSFAVVEGIVTDLSGSGFSVNGITVDAGSISTSGLANSQRVRVCGPVSNGTITAQQIEMR